MQEEKPITMSSFPKAIIHVDGDAFFTSVEQSLHPKLKGKPLVTGKERGIISCASYEAKALNIKRGISLWDARRMCPEIVVLPSDYESYSIYSKRMFEIMRRYTPEVEEYSIDEGFADITGMRQVFRCSYEDMAKRIQQDIRAELDITVSIGLSLTKSLAKIGSDFRKPRGFTAVRGRYIHLFLQRIPLADVWGLGPNSVQLLTKYGLRSAWDFVNLSDTWVHKLLKKPGLDIWTELRGTIVNPVDTKLKQPKHSISKGKTFTEPSENEAFIYAKLIRNLESACIKLRRHKLTAGELSVALRRRDYVEDGRCARLSRPANALNDMIPWVKAMFDSLYVPETMYRSTSVVLGRLHPIEQYQYDLFDDVKTTEKYLHVAETMDQINAKYGKHRIAHGPSLQLTDPHPNDRNEQTWRKKTLLPGETERKRLKYPLLDIKLTI
ncbi:MAG: DNA polymerase IV [Spartobacteria bacterium]|nr:DNA polymerase IV [Spartobacteria bacterium]